MSFLCSTYKWLVIVVESMAFAYFTLQRGRDPSPQAPTTSSEQISNTPEPNYRYAGADDERLEIEEEQTNHINSNQRTVTSSAHKVIILSNQVHFDLPDILFMILMVHLPILQMVTQENLRILFVWLTVDTPLIHPLALTLTGQLITIPLSLNQLWITNGLENDCR